jgi:uracil-DNA glycosylase family 4
MSVPTGHACKSCVLGNYNIPGPTASGFFKPDGLMRLGVMVVGETLEAEDGKQEKALVGSGGFLFGRVQQRKNRSRDDFRYIPAISCKPPTDLRADSGRLHGWAKSALNYCPYVLKEAEASRPKAILALGETAFEKLTGISAETINVRKEFMKSVRGYVFRDLSNQFWVIPTYHPSDIIQGQHHHAQTLMFDMEKAIKVAAEGYAYDAIDCLMDPPLPRWESYVREAITFLMSDLPRDQKVLAFDIETPFKGDDEQELDINEGEDVTFRIDRISFSFEHARGASVPWQMPWLIGIRQILEAAIENGISIIWNRPYDRPRIMEALKIHMPLEVTFDAMDAFHVLFNAQPRALGYATSILPSSFGIKMWKHLAKSDPAFYSVVDSVVLRRNWFDIMRMLEETGQKGVYDLVCRDLDPVLGSMTSTGMLVDQAAHGNLNALLQQRMAAIQTTMNAVVPKSIRNVKVWKTLKAAEKGLPLAIASGEAAPETVLEEIAGIVQLPTCTACNEAPVTAAHTKRRTVKRALPVA